MKLDFSTIIGFILAVGFVFMGMYLATGGDIPLLVALFINQPGSAAITVGGSIGGVIFSFPFGKLKTLAPIVMKSVKESSKVTEYRTLISEMVEYASEARRNGVLSLDAHTEKNEDPFIKKKGFNLLSMEQLLNKLKKSYNSKLNTLPSDMPIIKE